MKPPLPSTLPPPLFPTQPPKYGRPYAPNQAAASQTSFTDQSRNLYPRTPVPTHVKPTNTRVRPPVPIDYGQQMGPATVGNQNPAFPQTRHHGSVIPPPMGFQVPMSVRNLLPATVQKSSNSSPAHTRQVKLQTATTMNSNNGAADNSS